MKYDKDDIPVGPRPNLDRPTHTAGRARRTAGVVTTLAGFAAAGVVAPSLAQAQPVPPNPGEGTQPEVTGEGEMGRRVLLGANIGLTFANFTNISNSDQQRTLGGGSIGLLGWVPITPNLSLQTGVDYSVMGAGYTYDDGGGVYGDDELQIRIGYLSVPIMLRVDANTTGARPFFGIGPELSFRVHAHLRYDNSCAGYYCYGGYQDQFVEIDGDDVDPIDFGVTAGTGIDIPMQNTVVQLMFRYYRGFLQPVSGSAVSNQQFGGYVGLLL